jgi:hypothetical protein
MEIMLEKGPDSWTNLLPKISTLLRWAIVSRKSIKAKMTAVYSTDLKHLL